MTEKTTMTVKELAIQLGISIPKAYEVARNPDFPSINIGSRIVIPIEEYKKWLSKESTKNFKQLIKEGER